MYKIPKVNPSALLNTEHCGGYRPDGESSQAAVDGILFHSNMQEMFETTPRSQWDSFVSTRSASPQLLGMMEQAVATVKTVIIEDLPVFVNFRLRLRAGKPRKTPLKPGLYPECELERGPKSHGYIDLLVVTPEGLVYIFDWKTNRQPKDFSWQLGAYAVDINNLCPSHDHFICMIVAPRLDDDEQLRMEVGPKELEVLRSRIAAIEEKADNFGTTDDDIGHPGDQCETCHRKGRCKYQAAAVKAVAESVPQDLVTVTAKGKESVIQSLRSLVGPGGPYEGQVITAETFTHPRTVEQRGLRRACLKFVEVLVDKAKDDDKTWAKTWTPEQLKDLVPGFTVSWRAGRGTVDGSRMGDIRADVMAKFGLSMEDVFEVSDINREKLVDLLVAQGGKKTASAEAVKKLYEPYTTAGAPVLFWTQRPASKQAAIEAEFK